MSSLAAKLFVLLQYLIPARLLGALTYRLSRSRRPWLKNLLIRAFAYLFAIDQTEMDLARATDYPTFNAFFTRALQAGARPIAPEPGALCSPADGRIQQLGTIQAGQIFQAKHMSYSTATLLNAADHECAPLEGGAFMTVYLAPHNYHRVHAPADGTLRRMRFIPGARFSVNQATANAIPGLFARNERLACEFVTPRGAYWLVLVGAMNVSSISTAWSGEIDPGREPREQTWTGSTAPAFRKGDYLGQFNLGSTVILAFPPGSATWQSGLAPGATLRVGQHIGDRIAAQ